MSIWISIQRFAELFRSKAQPQYRLPTEAQRKKRRSGAYWQQKHQQTAGTHEVRLFCMNPELLMRARTLLIYGVHSGKEKRKSARCAADGWMDRSRHGAVTLLASPAGRFLMAKSQEAETQQIRRYKAGRLKGKEHNSLYLWQACSRLSAVQACSRSDRKAQKSFAPATQKR